MYSSNCKQKYTLAKICVKSSVANVFSVCIIPRKRKIGTHRLGTQSLGTQGNFHKENLRGVPSLGTQSMGTHSIGTYRAAFVPEVA